MTRRQQLAVDIERAFAEYLGVPTFDGEEWPALAVAISDVVENSQIIRGFAETPKQAAENAKDLMGNLSGLVSAVAAVME